jgi:nitrite reductase/ring-hydroxylating ferredoxin subunit
MVIEERVICASEELIEGGPGRRFEVESEGGTSAAFAIRFAGRAHAYLNRCAHVGVELDWQPGEFLDAEGLKLICTTHGATYDPASGECVAGPCRGARLISVPVEEQNGFIKLKRSSKGS